MLKLYTEHPAVPSSYFPNGVMGKKLGHNAFSASPWNRLQTEIARSLAKHAEWLVGKPIPKPLDLGDQGTKDAVPNAALERLKAYKDTVINNMANPGAVTATAPADVAAAGVGAKKPKTD